MDEDDAIFHLTWQYFRQLEYVFTESPYHWNYWDSFMQRSTMFGAKVLTSGRNSLICEMERLAISLAPRLKASPRTEALFTEFHKNCLALINQGGSSK